MIRGVRGYRKLLKLIHSYFLSNNPAVSHVITLYSNWRAIDADRTKDFYLKKKPNYHENIYLKSHDNSAFLFDYKFNFCL